MDLGLRAVRRYWAGISAGFFLVALLVIATISSLSAAHIVPPPPITNAVCVDAKFRLLKDPSIQPTIMAIGSSVTWRNLDSAALQAYFGAHEQVYDGAPCGLTIDKAYDLAKYYMSLYPQIHTIFSMVGRSDFIQCKPGDNVFFDWKDARRYMRGSMPETMFYFTHFDPVSFVRNTMWIKDGFLKMNEFGDFPVAERERDSGDFYTDMAIDPDCFKALRAYAEFLKKRNIQLIMYLMPVKPSWQARFDTDGRSLQVLRDGIQAALAGTTAVYVDATTLPVTDHDYHDAVHLQGASTHWVTKALLKQMPPGKAALH